MKAFFAKVTFLAFLNNVIGQDTKKVFQDDSLRFTERINALEIENAEQSSTIRDLGELVDELRSYVLCNPIPLICNATIPKVDLTASSIYQHTWDFGPHRSCLDNVQVGDLTGVWTAWIEDNSPWIQADFGTERLVKHIITQGRARNDQWVTQYKVRYSNDGTNWLLILNDVGSEKIFPGNTDRNTRVTNGLNGVLARYLRLYPLTYHAHRSMRWEALGC